MRRPPSSPKALPRAAVLRWSRSWLALPLLALPALWPLLVHGLPAAHDLPNHLMRLVAFDQQLRAGQWYPRWLPDLALGHGYPLYNYYAPSSLYLAEVFVLVGLSYEQALIGLFATLLLAAALGMWRLAADFFPAQPASTRGALALVAATAYLYAPYVLTNVYLRGAIAELGAQAVLPWALWGVRRLMVDPRPARWLVPAAISVAGLAVMHNLSLVLAAPLLAAWTGLLAWRAPDRARRLAWGAAAGVAAVALSAFYWWPLLGERAYLADTFEEVARTWLPDNLWRWPTFLDPVLVFQYDLSSPYPLGLAQVVLAVAGLWLARRWWNAEWLLLALAALGAGVLIGRPWAALWLGTPLLIVQFPWRLLILISLVLALFAAGSLLAVRSPGWRSVLAGLLLGVIILTQRPRLEDVGPSLARDLQELSTGSVAQFERQTGSLGATTNFLGTTSDFMPAWVNQAYGLTTTPATNEHLPAGDVSVRVTAASTMAMDLAISAPRPTRLRLSAFYFPGWRLTLDSGAALPTYPDTPLGLLSFDVPAGEHRVTVRWASTPLQNVSSAVSLLTLAGLVLFAWRGPRTPVSAALLGALAVIGGLAWFSTVLERPAPVQANEVPFEAEGIELLGYAYQRTGVRGLELRPYWFVRHPAPDLQFRWRLTDAAGRTVTETRTRPFFDTVPTTSWRGGTVVDDAYTLGLPGALRAGDYGLEVCAAPDGECEPQRVGVVAIAHTIPATEKLPPLTTLDARFGEAIVLAGYDLSDADGQSLIMTVTGVPVAAPGQTLRYTFYWRALRPPPVDYHSFIHLADAGLNVAARHDATLGPAYWPARLWDPHTWHRDVYELALPATTANGVYWPSMGLYDLATLERLPVRDAAGNDTGDTLRLQPVKVLASRRAAQPAPQAPARACLEAVACLMGYDLTLPPGGVRPGSRLTLTLYWRAEQPDARDLTRFVHLSSTTFGLAGQVDGTPQDGRNPTWAWVPGEVIVDTVVLTVQATAVEGPYELRLGLYDPAAGGARLLAQDGNGQPLPENVVVVDTVQVTP